MKQQPKTQGRRNSIVASIFSVAQRTRPRRNATNLDCGAVQRSPSRMLVYQGLPATYSALNMRPRPCDRCELADVAHCCQPTVVTVPEPRIPQSIPVITSRRARLRRGGEATALPTLPLERGPQQRGFWMDDQSISHKPPITPSRALPCIARQ